MQDRSNSEVNLKKKKKIKTLQIKQKQYKFLKERVPFLTSSVPDLSLDTLVLNDKSASLELNADGGFGVQTELVACEPSQYLRLPNRRVTYQHHLEHIVYLLVRISISCCSSSSTARHFQRELWISESFYSVLYGSSEIGEERLKSFFGACENCER